MMVNQGTIFSFGNEIVEVRLQDSRLLFRTSQFGGALAPLESLQLNQQGVLKEFPDLEGNPEWKTIAIQRLKDKLKDMTSDDERMSYVIVDLQKYGYKPLIKQKDGYRPEKLS